MREFERAKDSWETANRLPAIRFSVAILILAACAPSAEPLRPPAEFPFATVSRDCAPYDGPAVAIYLTPTAVAVDPSPPFVRISVWDAPAQVAGRTWTWPRAENRAAASRCVTDNDCVASTSGSVNAVRLSRSQAARSRSSAPRRSSASIAVISSTPTGREK